MGNLKDGIATAGHLETSSKVLSRLGFEGAEYVALNSAIGSLFAFPFERHGLIKQVNKMVTSGSPLSKWNGNGYSLFSNMSSYTCGYFCGVSGLVNIDRFEILPIIGMSFLFAVVSQPFNNLMIRKALGEKLSFLEEVEKIFARKSTIRQLYLGIPLNFAVHVITNSLCLAEMRILGLDEILSSSLYGLFSMVSFPLETIYRRLLAESGQPEALRKYKNGSDCYLKIVEHEGYKGFYKGSFPIAFSRVFVLPLAIVAWNLLDEVTGLKEHLLNI